MSRHSASGLRLQGLRRGGAGWGPRHHLPESRASHPYAWHPDARVRPGGGSAGLGRRSGRVADRSGWQHGTAWFYQLFLAPDGFRVVACLAVHQPGETLDAVACGIGCPPRRWSDEIPGRPRGSPGLAGNRILRGSRAGLARDGPRGPRQPVRTPRRQARSGLHVPRKRATFYNVLGYAVELELITSNPVDRVRWTAPRWRSPSTGGWWRTRPRSPRRAALRVGPRPVVEARPREGPD